MMNIAKNITITARIDVELDAVRSDLVARGFRSQAPTAPGAYTCQLGEHEDLVHLREVGWRSEAEVAMEHWHALEELVSIGRDYGASWQVTRRIALPPKVLGLHACARAAAARALHGTGLRLTFEPDDRRLHLTGRTAAGEALAIEVVEGEDGSTAIALRMEAGTDAPFPGLLMRQPVHHIAPWIEHIFPAVEEMYLHPATPAALLAATPEADEIWCDTSFRSGLRIAGIRASAAHESAHDAARRIAEELFHRLSRPGVAGSLYDLALCGDIRSLPGEGGEEAAAIVVEVDLRQHAEIDRGDLCDELLEAMAFAVAREASVELATRCYEEVLEEEDRQMHPIPGRRVLEGGTRLVFWNDPGVAMPSITALEQRIDGLDQAPPSATIGAG